ncbi:Uncharacterized protein TCM_031255 [Theobroma cacao]|uniref:Uncharacterized protein n=1 Tax=Theobroma cacao TaxID=3641 RepID=A0A061FE39_THECC|nr:Uncharacterized protein TCM_031255 [Theobroma cacao]
MCRQYRSTVAASNPVSLPNVSNEIKWRPPIHIKNNCDASTFVENGGKQVGAGFIVRGHNGEFLLGRGSKIAHYSSAAVAELKAHFGHCQKNLISGKKKDRGEGKRLLIKATKRIFGFAT